MFLLKLSLRPWRLAPLSQLFSAVAVGFLLVLAGFMFWMERGLKPVVMRLEHEQVITAYLDASVDPKDEHAIADQIRVAVGARPAEVRLVDSNEFVGELRDHYPELSKELENFGGEMNTFIPRYVSVAGMFPAAAVDKVKIIPGIESAETSAARFRNVAGAFAALRWVARLLGVGLVLALFTGLIHLARMNSYLHQESLTLLRLWGAGPWTLRAPALLSGIWVGTAGGAIALGGWLLGARFLATHIRELSPLLRELPMPTLLVGVMLLVSGATSGLLAGIIGGEGRV